MNTAIIFLIGFFVGCLFTGFLALVSWWDNFAQHGGTLLIDPDNCIYQLMLNNLDEVDEWENDRFIIFKVAHSSKPLQHIKDKPFDLEEE
jgi:hypothetical protein